MSLLQGPEPVLTAFDSPQQQAQFVAKEIQNLTEQGLLLSEIGIFARTRYLLSPVQEHLQSLQIPYINLNSQDNESGLAVRLGTMHRAKGLEFKAVFAIDLSDNTLPLPQALSEASDEEAKAESIELERHLLYVTITRARDFAYLCWQGSPTQFLVLHI